MFWLLDAIIQAGGLVTAENVLAEGGGLVDLRKILQRRAPSGYQIRGSTLTALMRRAEQNRRVTAILNRGQMPRNTPYPDGSGIPGCTGYYYRVTYLVTRPSDTDANKDVTASVPVEVYSRSPLDLGALIIKSRKAAESMTQREGDYRNLALGLKLGAFNVEFGKVISAYKC